MASTRPGEPRKVVGGIADEIVTPLRELGPVMERPNTYGAGTGVTYLAEHLKVAWEHLVTDSGARILLHALLQAATSRPPGGVSSIVVATRAGWRACARIFIDAWATPTCAPSPALATRRPAKSNPAQTLTTTFRMVNVDLTAAGRSTRPSSTG